MTTIRLYQVIKQSYVHRSVLIRNEIIAIKVV